MLTASREPEFPNQHVAPNGRTKGNRMRLGTLLLAAAFAASTASASEIWDAMRKHGCIDATPYVERLIKEGLIKPGPAVGALHSAVVFGCVLIVKALLEAGVDVDAKIGGVGETPLHDAARSGNPFTAEALLEAGADPNAANSYGGTPLHVAASNGNLRIIEILLEAGADCNAKTDAGGTPFDTSDYEFIKTELRRLC